MRANPNVLNAVASAGGRVLRDAKERLREDAKASRPGASEGEANNRVLRGQRAEGRRHAEEEIIEAGHPDTGASGTNGRNRRNLCRR